MFLSANSFLLKPMGKMRRLCENREKIDEFRREYEIPDDIGLTLADSNTLREDGQTLEQIHIPILFIAECGLRLPLHSFFREVCSKFNLNPLQLCPNFVRVVMGVVALNKLLNLDLNWWDICQMYTLVPTNGGKYYLKARDNDKKLITHLPDSSKGEGDDFLIVTGNWEPRGAEGKTIGFHCPHQFGKPPKLSSNINKEEQSRAIKLALTFDGFESTPLGFGRASHVLLNYTPSYWSGIRKEVKGRPRPPVEQEPAVEPQPELPSHPAGNKNKKGRGGSNNKKGGRRNRISSDRNTTVAILSEHLVGVEEDSYLSPATSPNMSRLGSPSDGTHPLTPPASLSSPTHPLTPPAGLSSPTAICLTTPPALGLSASANTSNIMDSSGISGKRARDITHMEVPSSRKNVGQSESSSSQLTKRVSQEAAYDLVQRAMEIFRQRYHEAEEQAKETKKKLIERNVRQSKIIEDLRKETDNLKNEKAAVERRAVETQKKIEEATCKTEILKAELQKTQNAFKHEFKHGHDRGYEDGTACPNASSRWESFNGT